MIVVAVFFTIVAAIAGSILQFHHSPRGQRWISRDY